MTLQIRTNNLELTPSLREYAQKRFSKLERFSNNIIHSELTLHEQRGQYFGEFILKVKGKTLKVSAQDKDLMALVDQLKDDMVISLKHYESRIKDHHPE